MSLTVIRLFRDSSDMREIITCTDFADFVSTVEEKGKHHKEFFRYSTVIWTWEVDSMI